MTTGHVFIASRLDGFIARLGGSTDWLDGLRTEGEDHGFDKFVSSVDGLIMGRGTYEKVLSFEKWPYQRPVMVLSKALGRDAVPPELSGLVELSTDTPEGIMAVASRKGWKRAYVDGGQVVQSFLRAGLIEDLIITQIPVLLGAGLPLFGPLSRDQWLDHVETTTFPSGLVQSKYRIQTDR